MFKVFGIEEIIKGFFGKEKVHIFKCIHISNFII